MSKKKSSKMGARGESPQKSSRPATSGSPMDVTLLEQIVKLMSANDLNTVDVRDGARRIVLKRGAAAPVMMAMGAPTMQAAPPAAVPPAAAQTTSASSGGAAGGASDEAGLIPIKSPMVGTYYSKPNPESKSFVNVGATVTEDSDVCIIEAMKTFNNIQAGCRGTIAKILCQDGETVDFGKVLFLVKPD